MSLNYPRRGRSSQASSTEARHNVATALRPNLGKLKKEDGLAQEGRRTALLMTASFRHQKIGKGLSVDRGMTYDIRVEGERRWRKEYRSVSQRHVRRAEGTHRWNLPERGFPRLAFQHGHHGAMVFAVASATRGQRGIRLRGSNEKKRSQSRHCQHDKQRNRGSLTHPHPWV